MDKEFDYVIVAVTYVNVRNQIEKELVDMGVSLDKFAEIDMSIMDEKHLLSVIL